MRGRRPAPFTGIHSCVRTPSFSSEGPRKTRSERTVARPRKQPPPTCFTLLSGQPPYFCSHHGKRHTSILVSREANPSTIFITHRRFFAYSRLVGVALVGQGLLQEKEYQRQGDHRQTGTHRIGKQVREPDKAGIVMVISGDTRHQNYKAFVCEYASVTDSTSLSGPRRNKGTKYPASVILGVHRSRDLMLHFSPGHAHDTAAHLPNTPDAENKEGK